MASAWPIQLIIAISVSALSLVCSIALWTPIALFTCLAIAVIIDIACLVSLCAHFTNNRQQAEHQENSHAINHLNSLQRKVSDVTDTPCEEIVAISNKVRNLAEESSLALHKSFTVLMENTQREQELLESITKDLTRREHQEKADGTQDVSLHQFATDPLTGLYNRNQLNIVLNKEMAREQRYNRSFGLLVIDVDFFKSINDSFGHEAGDNVLKQISQDLLQSVRKIDTVIRWGGEEFIVVASEVDKQSIVALSENLCKKIEGSEFNGVGRVTVSIGATLYKLDDTPSDLLSRADKALYKAKETGRNIAIYTS